jgi:hypothetical protein
MHYRIISTPDPRSAAGKPYENPEKCFSDLCVAGTAARTLGLVDPEHFEYRRNPPVRLHVSPREGTADPEWSVDEPEWALPGIGSWMLDYRASYRLPGVAVTGYDYHADDQPVLLEVWIEKTTMDDVLVPLCRDLNVNLVRAAGFESITAVVGLLRRAQRHGKPAHVLYVSDFDLAGAVMPVGVARQAQFWREELGIDAEVSVEQVALTAEQVAAYSLPHVLIKESDRRKARFEARNGRGAVELDALEALYSGVLAETVSHCDTALRRPRVARSAAPCGPRRPRPSSPAVARCDRQLARRAGRAGGRCSWCHRSLPRAVERVGPGAGHRPRAISAAARRSARGSGPTRRRDQDRVARTARAGRGRRGPLQAAVRQPAALVGAVPGVQDLAGKGCAMTTPADRAETMPVAELGRKQHDQRTGEQYARDLERETERSLERDPSRWHLAKAGDRDERRSRVRRWWRSKR